MGSEMCIRDSSSGVTLSISPTKNSSESYANSPLFDIEVIIDGKKQIFTMELGEEKKFNLTEDVAVIAADASVNRLDQPGIITLQKVEEECNRFKDIGDNPTPEDPVVAEDPLVADVDCALTPDIEECNSTSDIPWWLLILLAISILTLLRYLWNRRYLKAVSYTHLTLPTKRIV